jgi:hypothetical protein
MTERQKDRKTERQRDINHYVEDLKVFFDFDNTKSLLTLSDTKLGTRIYLFLRTHINN